MKIPMDHLRSKKKPVRKTVWIAGDAELAETLTDQKEALLRERSIAEMTLEKLTPEQATSDKIEELSSKIDHLTAEMDRIDADLKESSIEFTFQSLSGPRGDSLVTEHPATDAQKALAKEAGNDNLPFNPDTYPMALVLACLVTPEVTDENRDEIREWLSGPDWNGPEFFTLYMTALGVNNTRKVLEMGKGSSGMRISG